MSHPMVPPFQLLGPSNSPYPGTLCLPQVPLPAGTKVKEGDLATIQVVELAQHGAALYSVSRASSWSRSVVIFSTSPFHFPLLLSPPIFGPHRPPSFCGLANTPQCVDIIFAEPGDSKIAEVNETNCYNSTELGFGEMYTITTHEPVRDDALQEESGAVGWARGMGSGGAWGVLGWAPVVVGGLWAFL